MAESAKPEAVVTGVGAVSPLGDDLASMRFAIASGAAAPEAESGPAGLRCAPFDARRWFRIPKALKLTDHRTRMAVAAAAMARDDAGLADPAILEAAGVLIGTSGSDLQTADLSKALAGIDPAEAAGNIRTFGEKILAGLHPFWLLVNLPNMVSAHVSIQIGTRGPNSTVMTDWVAGAQAIGEAARWIASGECAVVFAGGADAGVLPFVHGSCAQASLIDWDGSGGMLPADGAAVFVVEEKDHALRRGARIYGSVAGYGSSCATSPGDKDDAGRRACVQASHEAGWDAWHEISAVPGLGFAFAAAAPLRMALSIGDRAAGERIMVRADGFLGQSVALALALSAEGM